MAPGGGHRLDVAGAPGWPTPLARATLAQCRPACDRPLWSRPLAQRFGPGHALVSDAGEVLLIDEGQQLLGPVLLEVVAPDGAVRARHGLAEVAQAAGLPADLVVQRASLGPWMSAPPLPDGMGVALEAGGVPLWLDWRSGQLARR